MAQVIVILALAALIALVMAVSVTRANAQENPEETIAAFVRWPVPLDDDLQQYIVHLCRDAEVDPSIVFAMIGVESGFQADTVGDSGASFGLMQIQPKWHRERMHRLGATNLLNPYQNVMVGIDLMAELLDTYDMSEALSVYNSGSPAGAPGYAYIVQRNAECLMEGVQVVGK